MVISFLGLRTDRHGFWNPHMDTQNVGTQKISTQSSKLVVGCRSLNNIPPRLQ